MKYQDVQAHVALIKSDIATIEGHVDEIDTQAGSYRDCTYELGCLERRIAHMSALVGLLKADLLEE